MAEYTSNMAKPIRVHKRLLQFNALPFAFGVVTGQNYTSTFKGQSQSYTNNAHGSYFPTLGDFGKLETSEFTATIAVKATTIAREDRLHFFRYIKRQLATSGKLWAVQNGTELIWTNARVVSVNEILDSPYETDILRLSITFELIDGYWVMASRTRTWLCEYCPANFTTFDPFYCWDDNEVAGRCDATGASACYPCINYERPMIKECDYQPLCFFPIINTARDGDGNVVAPSLVDIYSPTCPNEYFIDYSCEREAERFCYDAGWGRKYHLDARNPKNRTDIEYCSKTDLPTDFVRIRLQGKFAGTVRVQVNDDFVEIKDFVHEGIITLGYGTQISTALSDRDPYFGYADISRNGNVYRSNTPMFQIEPGINYITISGNVKGESSYAYILPQELTY